MNRTIYINIDGAIYDPDNIIDEEYAETECSSDTLIAECEQTEKLKGE